MADTVSRNTGAARKTGTAWLLLVVYWLWAVVPLTWGILETVRASLAFFR